MLPEYVMQLTSDHPQYSSIPINNIADLWLSIKPNSVIDKMSEKHSPPNPGKAFPPEFYYDTYSPLWQNRPRVYSFKLQWTQMNPNTVDRIVAYRLGIRQTGLPRWWEQEIPVEGTVTKGELITHNLTELIKPEAYEVRLTPITRFGEGDSTIRIITYSGEYTSRSCSDYYASTIGFVPFP
ncbi:hypothetical protein DPEC_G00089080 [Dallia pectoralis]|uniref:Uncharacterized protein n=1 Tax=Dallia pectoralis TaxID=75939 RepID=A0ACC2H0Y2_DALPE|nr:hypothetical protein DPEC_G00089080 [Dallia pectoralis]